MKELFSFFDAMNSGKFSYVDDMSDAEVKQLSPFVLLMWVAGATSNNDIHTIVTNSFVNPYVFSLSKHPRLLLKLFISANSDIDNARYKFVKSGASERSTAIKNAAHYYGLTYQQAKDIMPLLSDEDLKELEKFYS
jgi:hypothetical protein